MASLQKKGDAIYCQFCYLGKRHTVTVGKVSEREAEAFAGATDQILLRIKQKLITLPPGVGIDEFVLTGGKTPERPVPAVETISFSAFKQRYLDTHGNGAVEANSLQTVGMHLNHFERTLGEKFPLHALTLADLQRHVSFCRRRGDHLGPRRWLGLRGRSGQLLRPRADAAPANVGL